MNGKTKTTTLLTKILILITQTTMLAQSIKLGIAFLSISSAVEYKATRIGKILLSEMASMFQLCAARTLPMDAD